MASAQKLQCPECGNDDQSLMYVYRMEWFRMSDDRPIYEVDPAYDPDRFSDDDTIECMSPVEDTENPICHFRGAAVDFMLCGGGVDIRPIPDPETNGEAGADVPEEEGANVG